MEKLLNDGDNWLTLVKSTDSIMASSVIKMSKNWAAKLSITIGKTILPAITSQKEAHEEANQLNIINQSIIGTKEGVTKAIMKLVGSNVTNAILQTANRNNQKSINENDVLEQLIKMINHTFDFQKKVSIIEANAIKHGTNGHLPHRHWYPTVHTHSVGWRQNSHQIQLRPQILFGNAHHPQKYTYNHVHDAALLNFFLTELAVADAVWALKDTPALSAGRAYSVADSASFLHTILNNYTASAYTIFAYWASSKSDLANASPSNLIARNPNTQSCAGDPRKRRKTTTKSQRQTHAPTQRNSIKKSPFVSTWPSACGTKSTRAISSSWSAMNLKWLSCHATNSWRNRAGMQKRRLWGAIAGAWGQRLIGRRTATGG
jgi:hypothetical protein